MTKMHRASLNRGFPSSNAPAPGYQTLHSVLAQLSERLKASAHALNRRRLTANERLHWQTRGRQQLLRSAAHHLDELGVIHPTSSELFLALQDYLECLEKYEIDVQEEQQTPVTAHGWSVNRWKAEGAAQELPTVFADITHVLYIASPLIKSSVFHAGCFSL